jgi:protein-tyrosine-phosphatase
MSVFLIGLDHIHHSLISGGFMHSVLFVCTANICRSPLAMGLLREKVKDAQDWKIESAGTWTVDGEAAAARTIQVLDERGITLKDHHSRIITGDMLAQFNLILTMEHGHKEALKVEFPKMAKRIYLLSEMVGQKYEIEDPMGSSYQDFQVTANEIARIIDQGFDRIESLSKETP